MQGKLQTEYTKAIKPTDGTEEEVMAKLTVNPGEVLSEEQAVAINDALGAADRLVTDVISGKTGQMQTALSVAKAFDRFKRAKSTGK